MEKHSNPLASLPWDWRRVNVDLKDGADWLRVHEAEEVAPDDDGFGWGGIVRMDADPALVERLEALLAREGGEVETRLASPDVERKIECRCRVEPVQPDHLPNVYGIIPVVNLFAFKLRTPNTAAGPGGARPGAG